MKKEPCNCGDYEVLKKEHRELQEEHRDLQERISLQSQILKLKDQELDILKRKDADPVPDVVKIE